MSDTIRSLLSYARRLGWRLHPCHWIVDQRCSCGNPEHVVGDKAGKHPIFKGWPERATTDPELIERWSTRWPSANWAVATGIGSGLLVIDVDGVAGEHSLLGLERRHGPFPDLYCQQWTGGGREGWQVFFAYPQDRMIGSGAGKLGPKLDHRGEPGYALIPPSSTVERYRWAPDRSPFHLPPESPPPWLVNILDPPAPPDPEPSQERSQERWQASSFSSSRDRYVLRALESELAIIASAPPGRRNTQLNESAFSLFRFTREGLLAADAIVHGLEAAGRHAGLTDEEISATISSAMKARGLAS